jgi:hypothetical protein
MQTNDVRCLEEHDLLLLLTVPRRHLMVKSVLTGSDSSKELGPSSL